MSNLKINMTVADAARVMAFFVASTLPLHLLTKNTHIKEAESMEQEWMKKRDEMHKKRLLKGFREYLRMYEDLND